MISSVIVSRPKKIGHSALDERAQARIGREVERGVERVLEHRDREGIVAHREGDAGAS